MSLFNLRVTYDVAPGVCYLCGGNCNEGGVVDTGKYEDFVGRVYVCPNCVAEMSRLYGFATPLEMEAAVVEVTAERDAALARAVAAEEELAAAGSLVEALEQARSLLPPVLPPPEQVQSVPPKKARAPKGANAGEGNAVGELQTNTVPA